MTTVLDHRCERCGYTLAWHGLTGPTATKRPKAYCPAEPRERITARYAWSRGTRTAYRVTPTTEWVPNVRAGNIRDRSVVSPTFTAADIAAAHEILRSFIGEEVTS